MLRVSATIIYVYVYIYIYICVFCRNGGGGENCKSTVIIETRGEPFAFKNIKRS